MKKCGKQKKNIMFFHGFPTHLTSPVLRYAAPCVFCFLFLKTDHFFLSPPSAPRPPPRPLGPPAASGPLGGVEANCLLGR